jgi:hypothetical protein
MSSAVAELAWQMMTMVQRIDFGADAPDDDGLKATMALTMGYVAASAAKEMLEPAIAPEALVKTRRLISEVVTRLRSEFEAFNKTEGSA